MATFLENVVGKLPVSVQPYAKAVVPLVLGVVAAGQDLAFDAVEVDELKVLAWSVVTSVLVLAFPNLGYRAEPKKF